MIRKSRIFQMAPNITGFGPGFLRLAMALSYACLNHDFSGFSGEMIFAQWESRFEEPVFNVYKLDGVLWVITRGSLNDVDRLTCAAINEIQTKHGIFHEGFYKSAEYIYYMIKPYIQEHKGPIYFTGHSYGASVASCLFALFDDEYPDRESCCAAFGPMPMMDYTTALRHKQKMVSIIHHKDIVPTLSVENLYNRIKLLSPILKLLNKDQIVGILMNVIEVLNNGTVIDNNLYHMLKVVIPEVADGILGYIHETETRFVRWPPGYAYQLQITDPKKLEKCLVDQTSEFTILSIYPYAFSEHEPSEYTKALN